MFVLERILRGLSEESTKPAFSINSTYSELLLAVDGLRSKKSAKYDQKYYQSELELVTFRYLSKALMELKTRVNIVDSLKIALLAHDLRIRDEIKESGIDWINILKVLVEESQFPLLIRVVRFLSVNRKEEQKAEALLSAPLLLMNTINKTLNNAETDDYTTLTLLQLVSILDFSGCDEGFLNASLLKLLRRNSLNDRTKALTLKILKKTLPADESNSLERIFPEEQIKSSPILSAVLKESFGLFEGTTRRKSSSRLLNYQNGNYECFTEVEKFVLGCERRGTFDEKSEYEKYLLALKGKDEMELKIRDHNVLKDLIRLNLISIAKVKLQKIETIEDAEFLVEKTKEPNKFWGSLNQVPILTQKVLELKPRKDYLEYFESRNWDDIESFSLALRWYYMKCAKEFGSSKYEREDLKLLASKLSDLCKENFDGSGLKFKEIEEEF